MIKIKSDTCTNFPLYHCWDCKNDCLIKDIALLPEPFFWAYLHFSYTYMYDLMMSMGLPKVDIEYSTSMRIMSIVCARKKMNGELTLLQND